MDLDAAWRRELHRRAVAGRFDQPAKPRCPVCGVTGYRMARRTPDNTELIFWCRKGHPHYVQSFNPNDGPFFFRD